MMQRADDQTLFNIKYQTSNSIVCLSDYLTDAVSDSIFEIMDKI